jgi:predicted ABC-type ATPase
MADAGGKRIIIVAGPNGAGKTTFAREFLPQEAQCPVFINDVIRRRFVAGRDNFETLYKVVVDAWYLYDNSGKVPFLLDEGGKS